jgi:hypothetical protein
MRGRHRPLDLSDTLTKIGNKGSCLEHVLVLFLNL